MYSYRNSLFKRPRFIVPREKKVQWNAKLDPLALSLIKAEAKRTGESESEIVAAAVLAMCAKDPAYRDKILEHIDNSPRLRALFEAKAAFEREKPVHLPRR